MNACHYPKSAKIIVASWSASEFIQTTAYIFMSSKSYCSVCELGLFSKMFRLLSVLLVRTTSKSCAMSEAINSLVQCSGLESRPIYVSKEYQDEKDGMNISQEVRVDCLQVRQSFAYKFRGRRRFSNWSKMPSLCGSQLFDECCVKWELKSFRSTSGDPASSYWSLLRTCNSIIG